MTSLSNIGDFATASLGIAPITVRETDSIAGAEVSVSLRLVRVGRSLLQQRDGAVVAFALFHEVGHIYAADMFQGKAAPTPHDDEYIADRVGGWLCAAYGVNFGSASATAQTWVAQHYGATNLDGFTRAPLSERVAITLGLDATATHPSGTTRAQVIADGILTFLSGKPPL